MKELTLSGVEMLAVADIIMSLRATTGNSEKVVGYALGKGIALEYAGRSVGELEDFLKLVGKVARMCHMDPTFQPPKE